jgi:prepilin-type N-terminal cleavage/methylation domain-containing protein
MNMKFKQRGFTLPELLVAGGVIALILIGGAFLISSKVDVSKENRDSQRRMDVATIALAFKPYLEEYELPDGISAEEQFIGNNDGEFDLCAYLTPEYINDLPFDPLSGMITEANTCPTGNSVYNTGYSIQKSDDVVTLAAPFGETDQLIKIELDY